jgi:hypothetical protein
MCVDYIQLYLGATWMHHGDVPRVAPVLPPTTPVVPRLSRDITKDGCNTSRVCLFRCYLNDFSAVLVRDD